MTAMGRRGKGKIRRVSKVQPKLQAEVVFVPAYDADERLQKALDLVVKAGNRPENTVRVKPERGTE